MEGSFAHRPEVGWMVATRHEPMGFLGGRAHRAWGRPAGRRALRVNEWFGLPSVITLVVLGHFTLGAKASCARPSCAAKKGTAQRAAARHEPGIACNDWRHAQWNGNKNPSQEIVFRMDLLKAFC